MLLQLRNLLIELIVVLLVSISAQASLLDKIFPYSNVNRPEIWQDQLGGFATGGSIHARVPATNLKLLHLDLPDLKGGCGGIDLFSGGFGYINLPNLENLIKNIGTTAVSYSVMLTIKSLSPQISDLLENLEATARFINSQNINSCQMGASIAAGLFPKTQASQELACNARKMSNPNSVGSELGSYFTARYNCQNPVERDKTNDVDSSLLGPEYNLVWKALSKMAVEIDSTGQKKETTETVANKEFLMSLSGTLVAKTNSFEHKGSLIKNAQILDTIVLGSSTGQINLYKCDEAVKCLNPTVDAVAFTADQSVVSKVKALLNSIAEKIITESAAATGNAMPTTSTGGSTKSTTLSTEEQYLATTTSIPIIKLITLNAGLKGHGINLTIEDYAEAVAFDYVVNYLDSLLEFVYVAVANLEHAQIDEGKIKAFKEEIRHLKQMLYFERVKAFERLNTLLSVKMRAQAIEKTVLSHFVEFRGS